MNELNEFNISVHTGVSRLMHLNNICLFFRCFFKKVAIKYQPGTPDGTFPTFVEFVSYILLIGSLEKSFVKGETVSKNLEDDWTL